MNIIVYHSIKFSFYLCRTVLPAPARGPAPLAAFGERLPAPTEVALAGADGYKLKTKSLLSRRHCFQKVGELS